MCQLSWFLCQAGDVQLQGGLSTAGSHDCLVCGCFGQEGADEAATLPLKLIHPVLKALVATNTGKLVVLASLSPGFVRPGLYGLYTLCYMHERVTDWLQASSQGFIRRLDFWVVLRH